MLVDQKFVEAVASEKKYTFIFTGMSSLQDIEKVVSIFQKHHCPFELITYFNLPNAS